MSAVLHMDIEAVMRVAKELREMEMHLAEYARFLDNHINGLGQDWQAGSAVQFFDLYGQWRGDISAYASELAEIADKLTEEAATWAAMDRTF
jgi:WXG100 family type VII secretion target